MFSISRVRRTVKERLLEQSAVSCSKQQREEERGKKFSVVCRCGILLFPQRLMMMYV